MKKIILTAAAVFALSFANAQDVKFGAKAGLNLSNIGGDLENTSSKVGFQVGGFAEIKVSDKFAIQPELVFSTLGAKVDEAHLGIPDKYTFTSAYLNIPLLAKYYITDEFSLEAGPQIGFLMSAKDKAEGASDDVKDYYESIDFGLNFGAGYDVSKNINLGVRYSLGLSNIRIVSGDYKENNSNIAIAVGYKF